MTSTTLMTHLELEGANKGVLAVSASLTALFDADVIGVAACQTIPIYTDVPSAEALEMDRAEIAGEIDAAESQLRAALKGKARTISFRSHASYDDLAGFIAEQARAADFIITGPALPHSLIENTRRTDIGALVMEAGRPVLIVPPTANGLELNSVVVAWKDTKEARRAVADAMPLLKKAKNVLLAEIVPEGRRKPALDGLKDVAAWLERHGVKAEITVEHSSGPQVHHLYRLLTERRCDLIVAGAYGHNRLWEWGFGGVTMDFLISPDRCALLSH